MICTRVIEEVKDYQSAIKMTCDILEEKGAVNHTYYQAILDNIEKYGGYFYLGKGICMPHARTEDGAIKSGMCVLMVKNIKDEKELLELIGECYEDYNDSMWNRTRIKFFCRNQYWNTASKMGTSG